MIPPCRFHDRNLLTQKGLYRITSSNPMWHRTCNIQVSHVHFGHFDSRKHRLLAATRHFLAAGIEKSMGWGEVWEAVISSPNTRKEKSMPLFEYRCRKCGHVTEFLESPDNDSKHQCEQCGSRNTEKVFSAFAVKGSTSSRSSGASCPSGTCPLS